MCGPYAKRSGLRGCGADVCSGARAQQTQGSRCTSKRTADPDDQVRPNLGTWGLLMVRVLVHKAFLRRGVGLPAVAGFFPSPWALLSIILHRDSGLRGRVAAFLVRDLPSCAVVAILAPIWTALDGFADRWVALRACRRPMREAIRPKGAWSRCVLGRKSPTNPGGPVHVQTYGGSR